MSLPSAVLNVPVLSMPIPPSGAPVPVIMSLSSAVLNVPVLSMPTSDPVPVIMSLPSAVLNVPELLMPYRVLGLFLLAPTKPVIVSSPARVLAIPVLTMSSKPDSGTISASSVNVILESSIVIGRPRNYN